MFVFREITLNHIDTSNYYLKYETVDTCPICKAKIAPIYIASSLDTTTSASVFDYCRNCQNSFITKYEVHKTNDFYGGYNFFIMNSMKYSEPNRFARQKFDDKIITLSPQFDKIYNQALAAESSNLNEIAGLGYLS